MKKLNQSLSSTREFGLAAAAGLLLAATAVAQPLVRSGTSADQAGLVSVVNQFRIDVSSGGIFNPPGTPAPSPGIGRREINWDAPALDVFASPGFMPNDFFNSVSKRGALFSTPGTGLAVSQRSAAGNLADPLLRFGDISAQYNTEFAAFSQQRLFGIRGSTVMDTTFTIPTSPTERATVRGFGVVFCDVDLDSSTLLQFFNLSDELIFSQNVDNLDRGFSFLGASFTDGTQIARVRITAGNTVLGGRDGLSDLGFFQDVVVMDDFIYAEPIPAPGAATVVLGIAALAGLRRRR